MLTWEPVIGLEVHVQLATRTKIFCGCENRFGAPPNSLVCPVCLGYPGALPVLNRAAVDFAVKLALALSCEVRDESEFARKNYFYADLPKGYQVSQYDRPLAERGALRLPASGRAIRIHRLHLEEDAGKLLHDAPVAGPGDGGVTLADFNRCGVPLAEIVTEPDLASPAEAEEFLRALHQLLLYIGVSDGNMEEGSLRCDANVSLRPAGGEALGTKAEVKNLNSFRHVARALAYEIERQRELLDSGGRVVQETRGFDADSGATHSQRSKEAAHDYRYFPDPDLPRVVVSAERRTELAAELPELPWAVRERFVREYAVAETEAAELTASRELAAYFDRLVAAGGAPRAASNWLRNEVLRELKERHATLAEALAPERVAAILARVDDGTISLVGARQVQAELWSAGTDAPEGPDPLAVAERLGLVQVRDEAQLGEWCAAVAREFPRQVEELAAGRTQVLGFLVGQVMKRSGGRADARRVQELWREILASAGRIAEPR